MKWATSAAVTLAAITQGQAAESVAYTWDLQFRSKFLSPIGMVFYDKPIIVNDISAAYGEFYLGTWIATGLGVEGYGDTFADEFDLYAGWGHTYGQIRIQLNGMYFAVKDLDRANDDVWIAESQFSVPEFPLLKPYIRIRYYGEVGARSADRGWLVWSGVRRTQPLGFRLGKEEARFDLEFETAYADGPFGRDAGWVFSRLVASAPVRLGPHFAIAPSLLYQTPLGSQAEHLHPFTTHDELVTTVSFRWTF